jgi:cephalosporin-C deacetylase
LMERDDHLVFGGPARADLLVENGHDALLEGNLRIEAVSDFGRKILTETRPIRIRAGGSGKMKLDLGLLEPGFYRVSLELESTLDNRQTEFAIGVRPEEVLSPLDRPDDFEDYWMRARRELDAVAPQFRLIRQDTLCSDTREVFLLEMRSLGNILIRGWYSRPVKKGRYPAMLHVQGYNTVKGPEDLYRGDDMVSLALNIRGHGNSRDQVASPTNQPILYHQEDRETYFYRGAYMDCIRAVDFLYSREEVDTTRVAVEGGSQGGALSLATAALDKGRIDLCVPHVPFLSDFRDYFRIAAWPGGEVFQFMKEHPEIPEEEIYRALAYIDVKNLAPWVRAPVYMSVGLVDRTCPPHINFAAYNQLNVPKQYRAYPDAGHDLPGSYYAWVYEYIREQFGLTKD